MGFVYRLSWILQGDQKSSFIFMCESIKSVINILLRPREILKTALILKELNFYVKYPWSAQKWLARPFSRANSRQSGEFEIHRRQKSFSCGAISTNHG
jgi:hypothetical protein